MGGSGQHSVRSWTTVLLRMDWDAPADGDCGANRHVEAPRQQGSSLGFPRLLHFQTNLLPISQSSSSLSAYHLLFRLSRIMRVPLEVLDTIPFPSRLL